MIITVAGFKGGVGKSLTAIHLAAYLQQHGSTVLADGDPNRSALGWSKRGNSPFLVVEESDAGAIAEHEHAVLDTPARPSEEDLIGLAEASDLLVLPTAVDAFSLDALFQTVGMLQRLPQDRYRVLLTIVPPPPSKDGERAQEALEEVGLPVFKTYIRRRVALQRASLEGVPVYDVKHSGAAAAWEDYQTVGEEIFK